MTVSMNNTACNWLMYSIYTSNKTENEQENIDCTVGAVTGGFDSRTEQHFVWSTNCCFGSGCHVYVTCMFVNAPMTQEKILVWGNV
ncbi:hypothetical protein SFRURICE_016372 [Spodoptera frugiperda]|nr:hypothetical protein SFRURICE_016372 [Spodoptera frugiperda]